MGSPSDADSPPSNSDKLETSPDKISLLLNIENHKMSVEWILEGLLLGIICFIGVIGNVMSIYIFYSKSYGPSGRLFHRLMLGLSIYDLVYILTSILIFCLPQLSSGYAESEFYYRTIPYTLPVAHIGVTGSIYLTVAITLERFITVCYPFFRLSSNWSSRFFLAPICFFSIAYNIPKFFEIKCQKMYVEKVFINNSSNATFLDVTDLIDQDLISSPNLTFTEEWSLMPSEFRLSPAYIQYYILYSNFILLGLIPVILLLVLNILTYRRLRSYHNASQCPGWEGQQYKREVRLASVSLVIVIVFILSHSIRWIINGWEVMQIHNFQDGSLIWPHWIEITTHVSHVATALNSSANFFIYLAKHPDILFEQENNNAHIEMEEDILLQMRKRSKEVGSPCNEGFFFYNAMASSASCTTQIIVESQQDNSEETHLKEFPENVGVAD